MFPAAPFLASGLRMAFRGSAAAGLLVPGPGVNRCGLVLEQRADDLGRALPAGEHVAAGQVEGRIFRMVAGEIPQPMFAQSVDQTATQPFVLLVDPANKVQKRNVRIGISTAKLVEILSGVKEGDRIIAANLSTYQPGQLVSPKQTSTGTQESE